MGLDRIGKSAPSGLSDRESGRFLKKAAQKLLLLWDCGTETSTAQLKKVFCFFFSKKKPFPFPAQFHDRGAPSAAQLT
jgi:hypothetical protein